ncbi:hypothetical protein BJX76DRAFT_343364 [Aspergillus varians]
MVSPTTTTPGTGTARKKGVKEQLSSYHKFMQEEIPKFKAKHPGVAGREVFKKVAEMWKGAKVNPATQIG